MIVGLLLAGQILATNPAGFDSTLTLATYLARPQAAGATPPAEVRYIVRCDYVSGDIRGNVNQVERIRAVYTHHLGTAAARWDSVAIATAPGLDAPFGAPAPDSLMEGFAYSTANRAAALQPGFFGAMPPNAIRERNLVWDMSMIEGFASDYTTRLHFGVPLHAISGPVDLAGGGSFHNRDVRLTWSGTSVEAGRECALVQYDAFFNTLRVTTPGIDLQGRSHYWGTMWLARDDGRVLQATLYEDVLGELKLGASAQTQLIDVFRIGAFTRSAGR